MALERKVAGIYKHVQDTVSTTWTIAHGLGVYPIIDAWTIDGGDLKKIIPSEVNYIDANTCTLIFTLPISGFATVV